MYASSVDYKKLYSPAYFGKRVGVSSFAPDAFSSELAKFCAVNRISHVVDVGSGSGALAHQLRAAGLSVVTCDYEPAMADAMHFDLTGDVEEAVALHRLMSERTNGAQWLVTCLDVLEHMDIEHVFNAVRNLRVLSAGLVVASISTRPSSRDNRFHTTVIPMSTWKEILTTLGLQIEDDRIFSDARTIRRNFGSDPDLLLVNHWAQVDPFRDIELGEPSYLLLSKTGDDPTEAARPRIEDILDITYRRTKREQFGGQRIPDVALNIHHPQDFVLLRPLLDVLPRDGVTALIRSSVLLDDERSVLRGFFARAGVVCVEYEKAEEIRWKEIGSQWLISPAESNVAPSHILSRQLVESAKLNEVQTLQLQHGIWVESFPQRVTEFGSEKILCWGAQYQECFHGTEFDVAGRCLRGSFPGEFRQVGAAKFVDSRLNGSKDLLRWRLGIDVERYRSVVLLGTNLKWGKHKYPAQNVRERLAIAIKECPDIFFIVKLHPSERANEAEELIFPNSLVLDDIVLASMDLHVSRLVAGVDIVVSSLSTLLLDATVAGKPCIQYDTGNKHRYAEMQAVEIERLPSLLEPTAITRLSVNTGFAKYYAAAAGEPFYKHLRSLLEEKTSPVSSNLCSSVSFYSLAVTVEEQLAYSKAVKADALASRQEIDLLQKSSEAHRLSAEAHRSAAEEHRLKAEAIEASALQTKANLDVLAHDHACLKDELRRAQDELGRAQDELVRERHERSALLSTLSWKVTAPLRAVRRSWPR
jgi:hypothetical protein